MQASEKTGESARSSMKSRAEAPAKAQSCRTPPRRPGQKERGSGTATQMDIVACEETHA